MAFLHLLMSMLVRLFFRVRVRGLEHLPKSGPVLLAPNHQSFLDALLLFMILPRKPRFLISSEINKRWWVRPFSRVGRAIPLGKPDRLRGVITALREARKILDSGEVVGIFPEGALSRIGQVLPFQRGYHRIVRDTGAVIVPVGIDGAQESFLAPRRQGIRSFPKPWWRRTLVTVVIGEPMPGDTSPPELRQRVLELVADGFADRKELEKPLHEQALETLRSRKLKRDFADHNTPDGPVRNLKVLGGFGALGDKLAPRVKDEEYVGVLLPPCIAATVVNLVLVTAGRTSINLNYTASTAVLGQIREQTKMRVVITSRLFLDKLGLELPDDLELILLEDLRESISGGEKIAGLLRGLFLPVRAFEKRWGRSKPAHVDDVVALLFSSGSTGVPKGVMLSHWNLLSNIRGVLLRIEVNKDGRLLGALPFFHVFGFMASLWLPLVRGIACTYHVNPLDARVIGGLVYRDNVSIIFATPTFLARYTRRVLPWQFGSLKVVISGAEKLRDKTAREFEDRFGIRPLEGFGCTECSPVVALCTPNFRKPGVFQRSAREGSVGMPLPGVVVRIDDLDSGERVGVGESGMLYAKGPNIMQGYYKLEEKTAEVLNDGWYKTGDVARVDEDGFVYITDRLNRFSKIAGEMVPHIRVEDILQKESGEKDMCFAVTGVPDEQKGEKLVVLHTCDEETALAARDKLGDAPWSLPKIWIPKKNDFIKVDEIPVLGSGKLDLVKIRKTAEGKGEEKDEG